MGYFLKTISVLTVFTDASGIELLRWLPKLHSTASSGVKKFVLKAICSPGHRRSSHDGMVLGVECGCAQSSKISEREFSVDLVENYIQLVKSKATKEKWDSSTDHGKQVSKAKKNHAATSQSTRKVWNLEGGGGSGLGSRHNLPHHLIEVGSTDL